MKRLLAFSLAVVLVLLLPMAPVSADVTEAKLTAGDDGAAGDYFGYSVSISGDYAVVGAWGDDDNGSDNGSAYVFERSGDDWSQQAKLTADDGATDDGFGNSVSISGDYAVVGASGADINGKTNAGAAYVFVRNGSTWSQQAKLTASDNAAVDAFGYSVSISGDYVVVGAMGDDDNGSWSGSAYVFERTDTTWSQQDKLTADDGATFDFFGNSVSISGDYVVVGAVRDDDKGADSGSAYVFERNGSDWSQQDKLIADDDGAAGDSFGWSVSISGDTVVVGAHQDDVDSNTDVGSAYVFERNGSDWSQQDKLTADDGAADDYFGISVSTSGDTVVVGAYRHDINSVSSVGSAYVFERNGSDWSQQDKLTASDGAKDDFFGYSVSISGDYAVVGAYYDDDDGTDSGSAYVYTEQQQYTLTINIVGNGSVTKNPDQETYTEGTDVTLTANPDSGWVFDSWSGDLSGSTSPETITMDDNKSVTATFIVETLDVEIDIKPGSEPNSINPDSQGVISVAILTTPDFFDAASVNASTVTFGPGAATMVHKKAHLEDVDEDGDIDMVLHFKTQETGIAEGDTEATLTGKTIDGKDFIGTDSVVTVPPEGKGKANSSSNPGNGNGQGNGGGNSNPGNGNGQGNGGGNPNPGNGNGQGNGGGNPNPGKGKGKGKGE